MADKNEIINYQHIFDRLKYYFPDSLYLKKSFDKHTDLSDIIHTPAGFLPYLQTALLDEKFIEVRFDDGEDLYFTKIVDAPIEKTESEDEEQPEYVLAGYLKEMSHMISLPLEPGMGNFFIRKSEKVVFRMFTKSLAVEFGTSFLDFLRIDEIPYLHFRYPVIGQLLRGEREYRAKVSEEINLTVIIKGKRKQDDIETKMVDISVNGLATSFPRKNRGDIFVGETRSLTIFQDGEKLARVSCYVRHLTRVRQENSIDNISGVEFELATKDLRRKIESLVAMVQRAHLQKISGMARDTGYNLIA